jgi:hypothetical protein
MTDKIIKKKGETPKFKRPVTTVKAGGRKIVEEYDPKKHGEAPKGVKANRREAALAELDKKAEAAKPTKADGKKGK